jgi:hypothetical protein
MDIIERKEREGSTTTAAFNEGDDDPNLLSSRSSLLSVEYNVQYGYEDGHGDEYENGYIIEGENEREHEIAREYDNENEGLIEDEDTTMIAGGNENEGEHAAKS